MKFIFWGSLLLTAYAYFGYAVWLMVYVRLRRVPVRVAPITPSVSILIAARNEEANLPSKFDNLKQLHYPAGLLQIVIASDGSDDGTAELLLQSQPFITPVILEQSGGKAVALNAAVAASIGEILVFLDCRQTVDPEALHQLVQCFADPTVGAVSGELVLEAAAGAAAGSALGIYWKIEKVVRRLESASGSVVGVTGAIYAIRRELYQPIPSGTILDDVFVPMHVARAGYRVIFQSSAIARDRIFSEGGKEFSRKVRTLTGNYQLLSLAPWILSPANPLLFRFISHKLLRLLVPVFLLGMLTASALTAGSFYHFVFAMQIVFYLFAVLGAFVPSTTRYKPIAIANTFVMLNTAAALAFYNFLTGRNRVWVR
jgi:biofilm PGA synthesis N-glycosyltransferase PgaC